MIVLVLRGGLGNQMYEYAAAIALASHSHTNIVLNTKLGFVTDKEFKRKYCLDCFGVKYKQNRLLSFDFPAGDIVEKISYRIGRHLFAPWYRVVSDKNIDIQHLKGNPQQYRNIVMMGTWNRMDDFCDLYRDKILEAFQLKYSYPPAVQKYIDMIRVCRKPVVAIGVRLFQEIKDRTNTPTRQNPLSSTYYTEAMNWYLAKYGHVKFLVFTQVPQWFKDNIPIEKYDFEIVDTGSDDSTAVFDMFIFASCQHYILSHSTFYAWGEKLNRSKTKDVIIPQTWSMAVKENWVKIESTYAI